MKIPALLSSLAILACAPVHAADAQPADPGEPAVHKFVTEDDSTRIDELRVRGQTQRITVTNKRALKGSSYEILPTDGLRDLPSDASGNRGGAGQRVWSVLTF